MNLSSFSSDRTEARSTLFTEQEAFWTLPLHETSAIIDVAVTKGIYEMKKKSGGLQIVYDEECQGEILF